jgi:hypothetical protein
VTETQILQHLRRIILLQVPQVKRPRALRLAQAFAHYLPQCSRTRPCTAVQLIVEQAQREVPEIVEALEELRNH